MKALIVDDCASVRKVVSKYLEKWGFEPIAANDANHALEILCEHEEPPRLMIIDWMMPNVSGPELISVIRQRDVKREIYIIMLTAKTGEEVLESAFACGADDYLAKPVVESELQRRVFEGRNILERQDEVVGTIDRLSHPATS